MPDVAAAPERTLPHSLDAEKSVLGAILTQASVLALVGLASGLAASLAVTRLLSSLLFGVKPTDPATLAGVAALLALVALASSWIPARRAAGVDPSVALRYE